MSSLGGDVIALQMEDHYVRIHTPTGSRLVHMTLSEAIDAVSPTDGLKTHRSWWVARHAVERIEGTPRAMRLHLRGGVSAPVARGAFVLLCEAGWIGVTAA
ncbi:LytTR family DNA-binding domain-containing protein [Acidomonas methanolica]|uniref:LytTR family DNA-binding domain-containing protein n=1 Tax=Acidomonas methanolica TaxID=437 RepID=UPI00211A96F2|nr:LytTR family transcriptional regulator DNA-binding domain-containing protein [Acidomonas methanolica]